MSFEKVHREALQFFKELMDDFNARHFQKTKFSTNKYSAIVPRLVEMSISEPRRFQERYGGDNDLKKRAWRIAEDCWEVLMNGADRLTENEIDFLAEDIARAREFVLATGGL